MFFAKVAITLVFLIFITFGISKEYKKLDKEDQKTFKRELLFETGLLYVGHILLIISLIFLNSFLMSLSVTLILVGLTYLSILTWRESRRRSIAAMILILIGGYIYIAYLK